jgi:hypothetical protein
VKFNGMQADSFQRKYIIWLIFLLHSTFGTKAQQNTSGNIFFLQPELLVGRNIPVYDDFPESDIRSTFMMNLGAIHRNPEKHWVSFYNYPSTGVSIMYSNLGNPVIYGNEMSIVPHMILKTSADPRRSFNFKIGLGASYFDNPYDAIENPENLVIGSNYNWAFQLFSYKNLIVSHNMILKIGLGYVHHSNSHTKLPNYGMNSVLLSVASQFPTRSFDPDFALKQGKLPVDKQKHYFIYIRSGYGWHELGGTFQPIGGPTWPVYSQSISGGIIFKQQIKVRAGITHRFYKSFYEDILKYHVRGLGENPISEATNINVFIGCEFLIGHVGFDIEAGYNLHKPYYREYNFRFEWKEGFEYWRARYISSRIGLKYYLISNEKMPRHNISAGTHINANFGEADFMDVSLGYTYLIK